ncbi:MAG: methylated-DNA--[protein]-cysteine S-methyltransferase, partial [bacterium]
SSPYHLQREFRRRLGVTPARYAAALRERSLKSRLREGQPIAAATYDAGYGSSSRVYERNFGMTPATYARGGRGASIRYTIAGCACGRVLVASTHRGVCAVSLGDSDGALEAALRGEFPHAEIARDDRVMRAAVRAVVRGATAGLPLDVAATVFQGRVWAELRKIAPGTTRTYGEVARAIGRPGAARAVARACASNPVALVIPCHRVVPAGGGAGGYRWGAARKQFLLETETKSGAAR